jgi:hypothetical protein
MSLAFAELDRRLTPMGEISLRHDHLDTTGQVFAACAAHVVTFPNHHTGRDASNTVYVAAGASNGRGRSGSLGLRPDQAAQGPGTWPGPPAVSVALWVRRR